MFPYANRRPRRRHRRVGFWLVSAWLCIVLSSNASGGQLDQEVKPGARAETSAGSAAHADKQSASEVARVDESELDGVDKEVALAIYIAIEQFLRDEQHAGGESKTKAFGRVNGIGVFRDPGFVVVSIDISRPSSFGGGYTYTVSLENFSVVLSQPWR